jgi:hypothetical protein
MEPSPDNCELGEEQTYLLTEALGTAIRKRLPLTDSVILSACIHTLANALASIECAGCRKAAREEIERYLPKVFDQAMKANRASMSDCVH